MRVALLNKCPSLIGELDVHLVCRDDVDRRETSDEEICTPATVDIYYMTRQGGANKNAKAKA